ncbi:MAG: hypothetical protein ABI822_21650, partial [Bryobacteraceae bacterium]
DILTLACLTAIVPWAFRSPETAPLAHGAEMVGLARWLRRGERNESALALFRRAIQKGLPDELMFRTIWDMALLEKKLGRDAAAMTLFSELTECRNNHRLTAFEEVAKYYEHRERNYAMALEITLSAIALEDSDEWRRRQIRLERRLEGKRTRRMLL